jgi:hypothetical protein
VRWIRWLTLRRLFSSFRNQNSMESANDGLNLGKRFPDLEPEKYKENK